MWKEEVNCILHALALFNKTSTVSTEIVVETTISLETVDVLLNNF